MVANINTVATATIRSCRPTSLVKLVAITPEPTIDAAKNPVPTSSAKNVRSFIYETPMMSTTNMSVSFGPIGPEPFGP